MRARGSVHQFLANNNFYTALVQDDGFSEAAAVRGAQSCIAALKPALTGRVKEEIARLIALLEAFGTGGMRALQIEAIVQSSGRIIDVAETLGFLDLSIAVRRLRLSCRGAADVRDNDAPDIASHREELRTISAMMMG